MIKTSVKHIFYIFIYIMMVSCDGSYLGNPLAVTGPSDYLECDEENYMTTTAPDLEMDSNGYYKLKWIEGYMQTFSTLKADTGYEGSYERVSWISNKEIEINDEWINIVNTSSYTNEYGTAHTVLGVWEEFIGDTIKVYSGNFDACGTQYLDSLEVIVYD